MAQFVDGTCYRGDWEHGLMHGKGFFEWPDKTRYEGDVAYGFLTGKVRMLVHRPLSLRRALT
jgi:hypothetical protein